MTNSLNLSQTVSLEGAVVGFGFIGSQGHVPAYLKRPDVKIVAVADICEARRHLAAQVLPDVRIYTDAESLLASESELDFIDIATPPHAHTPIALAALRQGIHVLCEKPLTTSLEEARSLLEEAKIARRVLFPCHNYKHAPVVKAVSSVIESGAIGKVRSVTLSTFRNTHAKGVPEWKTDWRRNRRYSGGGIAMDHGSHTFYLTFDWLGQYPTSVTAKMTTAAPDVTGLKPYDTEDNYSAVLTFPQGLAHVHLTWTAGVRKIIYTVQGEKGAITVDDDRLEIARMEKTDGPDVAQGAPQGAMAWSIERKEISSHWMDASHVNWFNSMFDQFKKAISLHEWVGKEAKEAYRCIEIIDASYRSASDHCREIPLAGIPAVLQS